MLDEESDLDSPENPVTEVKDGSVDFDDVVFSYTSRPGEPGAGSCEPAHSAPAQTVGILGGTGSSKSSLVQLIPRLYDVTEGSVQVGGVDVRGLRPGQPCATQVAMVLQKNVLFSGTIEENLRWGNEDATDEELRQACELAQADELYPAASRTGTTPTSSRAAPTCPAARSSGSASPGPC